MRLVFLSFICIALSGCSKKPPISDDLNYLIGDYDFVYSYDYGGEYEVNSDLPNKYGIRITSKHKLKIFKDGLEVDSYKLVGEEQYEPALEMSYVYIKHARNSWYPFYFSGDTIMMRLSPSTNNDNYFLKQ
ncbi:MAG: hypothetical protein ACI865_002154 [Flavobacteriaceae bacterium]|jgi:hypothetical protein